MFLVTGADGFIGSNLCKALPEDKIIKWDLVNGKRNNISSIPKGIKAIFHLGAISSTQEFDVERLSDLNVLSSAELLEYAINNNIPFVYASSASVYGLGDAGFVEDAPVCPINYYAISKASFDMFVQQKIKDNPDCKVYGLRYFNVYGNGEGHKGSMASPVHKFYEQARQTGKIQIFEGSDKFRRDFVSVQDVVKITIEAASFANSGIYNVGTGVARSFSEVAEIIASKTDSEIQFVPFPDSLVGKYQEFTKSDNSKLLAQYKHSFLSLEDGIDNFISLANK